MFEARNIHKTYNHAAKALHVLKDVTLTINTGEIISVVGPSGAGKSTLLHILGGLDSPDSGQVFFDGQELYALNDRQRAEMRNQKIGFIFQFYHLLQQFDALENVILPALVRHNMGDVPSLRKKGLALLEQVGLTARAHHRPNQLSGGEQQRVAVARALINEPKIIFCDEPTGNLDSASGQDIINLLKQLNARNQQTVVVVTHDEEIAKISDRKIQMRDGQLFE